jgi:glucan phosphoethanolaminetransferase (alkaline phosphatase superfamily)
MLIAISISLFLIFLAISSIHFYWAFGGGWGADAVLPTSSDENTKVLNPSILATLIVALGLLSFGIFVLVKSVFFIFTMPTWLDTSGLWIICTIFSLRALGDFHYVGFFKKIRNTKFAKNDSKIFTPLCLLIGVLALILALNQ